MHHLLVNRLFWMWLLLWSVPVQARHDAPALYAGATPCSRVVAGQPDAAATLAFLSGYGTARYAGSRRRSVAETDPLFGLPSEAALGWVKDWCRAQPDRTLADAAAHFFDQLPGAGPVVVPIFNAAPVAPASCSALAVGACSACSVICAAGQHAACTPGRERAGTGPGIARCAVASQCECR
jgi:hypothetical protein